jgi:hypothetical protein
MDASTQVQPIVSLQRSAELRQVFDFSYLIMTDQRAGERVGGFFKSFFICHLEADRLMAEPV